MPFIDFINVNIYIILFLELYSIFIYYFLSSKYFFLSQIGLFLFFFFLYDFLQ